MSSTVPDSALTSDQLLELANYKRAFADDLDGAFSQAGGDSATRFRYTVTGSEPDLTEITITLPTTRAANTYIVTTEQEAYASMLDARVLNADKTTTTFKLLLSSAATAGDVFAFIVRDV